MRGRVSLRDIAVGSGLPLGRVRKLRRGEGLGETKSLAQALGVTASTIRRWKSKGVPVSRIAAIGNILLDREAQAKSEVKEKKRIRKLITRARKTGILAKPLISGTKRFGGARAAGLKTIYKINKYLDVSVLETIEELVSQAPKSPRYILTVEAVEDGVTGKVRGYRGRKQAFTQKLGKRAENIAFGTVITSGTHTSKRAALAQLFTKLQDAIDDIDALVYLTDLVVFSYQYKDTELSRKLRDRG